MSRTAVRPHVVIVGAGFAGFQAARTLSRLTRGRTDITLLNPTDYFLYLPLLPQVAAGVLAAVTALADKIAGQPPIAVRGSKRAVDKGLDVVYMDNVPMGIDGDDPAEVESRLIELMEGVEDIPGAALHEGLSWNWKSFPEYLDAVDSIPHDLDIGAQLPHGALRLHVMGERGANRIGIASFESGGVIVDAGKNSSGRSAYTPTLPAAERSSTNVRSLIDL